MPANDYYGDGETAAPAASSPPNSASDTKGPEENEEYKSVLVPKDICATDMQVGDEFRVRVEQVLEDQYSVKYVSEPEEEEEEPPEEPAGPTKPPGELASLYE